MSNDSMRQQAQNDASQNKGPANDSDWSSQQRETYNAQYSSTKVSNSGK